MPKIDKAENKEITVSDQITLKLRPKPAETAPEPIIIKFKDLSNNTDRMLYVLLATKFNNVEVS